MLLAGIIRHMQLIVLEIFSHGEKDTLDTKDSQMKNYLEKLKSILKTESLLKSL